MDLLRGLNTEQHQAVLTTVGPVLVLAGAGSGKTKTLVHRLAYLVSHEKVPPEQVLAVTFTNKAAQAMRQRLAQLLGRPKHNVTVGTFHSVSCRFLRQEASRLGYPIHFSIYDEDDQKSLIKEALRDLGMGTKKVQPGAVLSAISRAKADLLTPTAYAREIADDYFTEVVAKVYLRYQELLNQNRAFDFDDLISQMVKLWQEQPAVLERYQKKYRYLLIDEYQDVNRAQYEWTRLLAQKYRNLCVVGDDWQSIYGWRGADFGNILRFSEDYPEAKVIKLEQNYRSTQIIVAASNAVMKKAELKADKTLWTRNPLGGEIKIVEVENEVAEARFVVEEIINLTSVKVGHPQTVKLQETTLVPEYEKGAEEFGALPDYMKIKHFAGSRDLLKKFAVLYRTNAQSRALEEACLRAGMPYQLVGGVRFYERREVKDVLAYLRLILNPADGVSFERAILSSPRGVGLTTVEVVLTHAKEKKVSVIEAAASAELGLKEARAQSLLAFAHLIGNLNRQLASLSVSDLIDAVVQKGGLGEHLADGTTQGEVRLENIEELKTVAEARAAGRGRETLEKFLTDVSLWQDQDNFDENQGSVTLMTVHAAKGLEFDTVFVVGMEEGLFPHSSSFDDPRELEEERRLAYVALTRARDQVYCAWALQRRIFGQVQDGLPSRFLGELPATLVKTTSLIPF